MRAAGRFPISSNSNSDKRPVCHAPAHEHTVPRPNVDQHSGTYLYSDECAHHHVYAYEFAYADFDAVGHGYTCPDGHTDACELTYTVTDTNQHPDTRSYGHSDVYQFTYAVSDTNEDPHTRAYGHTDSHKYNVADTGS